MPLSLTTTMPIERRRWLLSAPRRVRKAVLRDLARDEALYLETDWVTWARTEQLAPAHDWRTWLVCAGRGFGKTRTGSEWINAVARTSPQARIALVGASIGEVRAVMVEGESGVLACRSHKDRPQFEASLRRLTWPSGAQAWLYSAGEPESLRGPQHSHACRAGPEGGLCKRSLVPRRYAAAPGRGKPDQHSASHSC
jgi:phage terminase large subunit-like protein